MNFSEQYNNLIEQRKKITEDVDYDNDPVIAQLIKLITENMDDTINFLDNDCTEENFIWLSEIFDEIVEKSPRQDFIAALRRTAQKYPKAVTQYNIAYFIDTAEAIILEKT